MAFDESLAGGIRDALAHKSNIVEKKMFGGVCFLLNGNVLVGVWKDSLIVRVGPDAYEAALTEPHVKEFDITGRPMKGYVFVEPDGYASDEALLEWVSGSHRFAAGLPPKTPGKAHRGPSPASSSGATGKKRRP